MKIWLVSVGEPLPTDSGNQRLYRFGIISQVMADAGHDVTWWSSTFNHATKLHRHPAFRQEDISHNLCLLQLHGCAYRRNVSLARIRNHRQIAAEFAVKALARPVPDIILCSYPTIELCEEAVNYGKAHGVPVVIDVRDLWPDIFLDIAPSALRWFGRIALAGMFRGKRIAFAHARSIIGTNDGFVDWGVTAASRQRTRFDRSFALAYPKPRIEPEQRTAAMEFWRNHFGGDFPSNLICFFGNFADQILDLDTVIRAARLLQSSGEDAHFVLCGIGPSRARLLKAAEDLRTVTFPGRIGSAEIRILMEHSMVGLVPYLPRWDFERAMPNKAVEYLSGGLPVLTCLKGELSRTLASSDCGLFYGAGNEMELTGAIRGLISNPAEQRRLGASAMALFKSQFQAERVYGDYLSHIVLVAQSAKDAF